MSALDAPGKGEPVDMPRVNDSSWGLSENARLQATLRSMREGTADDWTMADFENYLRFFKRRQPETIRKTIGQLEFMARHNLFPVTLHGSRADLVESFSMYATAREQIDKASPSALRNDHKAVRALGAFRSIPENVWPTSPPLVEGEPASVPSPEQVFDLLHTNYAPRYSYENMLTRYMLAFTFGFGVRAPSEVWALRVGDVDLSHGSLVITEPKKSGRRRAVVVEPAWLMNSARRMSLATWMEKWRPLSNPATDALFPNVDGKAFSSKFALAQFLKRAVQPRFPWYHPYVARHWSCNARLIDSGRDWNAVARFHGHENVKMTMNTYAPAVELHERKFGKNWLTRAFGRPLKTRGGGDSERPR